MSSRLDQDREAVLQPQRMKSCKKAIEDLGFVVTEVGATQLQFDFKGSKVMFFPYSGWHSGKTIEDGRGFGHLLRQIGG